MSKRRKKPTRWGYGYILSIYVGERFYKRLQRWADHFGCTRSRFIRACCEWVMNNLEQESERRQD